MLTKLFAGLALAAAVTAGGYAANCGPNSCCFPGAACCEAGLACCDTGSCCFDGSPAVTVTAKPATTNCCDAGEPCCAK